MEVAVLMVAVVLLLVYIASLRLEIDELRILLEKQQDENKRYVSEKRHPYIPPPPPVN